jgi:hypothetical protein
LLYNSKYKPASIVAKEIGRILKELVILLGHLSKGIIIFIAKKAITEGKPKAKQLARWLKQQTMVIVRKVKDIEKPKAKQVGHLLIHLTILAARKLKAQGVPKAIEAAKVLQHYITVLAIKLNQVGRPKAIEAGQISKALLIITGRKLETEGLPKAIEAGQISKALLIITGRKLETEGLPKAIEAGQLLKNQFTTFISKGIDKIVEQTSKALREDDILSYESYRKEHSTSTTTSAKVSSEIILEKEKRIDLNERLAKGIVQNGIECTAIKDIESVQIERSPYYSYLFAMSPRIVTNRGCIRLQDNESKRRNVSLIQIIQKN